MTELERELGRLEGEMRAKAQLTEKAESTLREQLERERQRVDEESHRVVEERNRANRWEARAEQLRDELEAERSKGFWARLFGG